MYMIMSIAAFIFAVCTNDLRLMIFSAVFAFIDVLDTFARRTKRITTFTQNQKNPAGKNRDSETGIMLEDKNGY